jgi:hypothetical protein
MKRRIACASAMVTLLTSAAAFPCGMSFGNNVTIDPHQDIIVAWKDGIETYAFQPTFCGTATDFGLILPVPAQLSKSPDNTTTDPQAFAAAATLSEPYKHQVTEQSNVAGCATTGSGSENLAGGTDDSPAVVASGRVGFLDWVELKASTESSFTDWLTANGYAYSSAASSVFSYYVTKGWYFLAFRISQAAVSGNGTVCRALGPVVLSFPSSAPVVPSRMAAADSTGAYSRVTWRIFGITDGDVQLTFPATNSYDQVLWYSGAIKDADIASFGGLAQSGDRLTRLTYSFYKASVTADVDLALAPAKDYRGTEDVVVHDDSACSIRPYSRSHSGLLSLAGLSMVALFAWRRCRS